MRSADSGREWRSTTVPLPGEVAEELHVPGPNILRALALLGLPGEVQDAVVAGTIAPSVAYEVSKLERPEEQTALAERVVKEGLTRDQVTATVKGRGAGKPKVEFKLDGGRKVTVSGLPDDEIETVISALKAALRAAQSRAKSEAA